MIPLPVTTTRYNSTGITLRYVSMRRMRSGTEQAVAPHGGSGGQGYYTTSHRSPDCGNKLAHYNPPAQQWLLLRAALRLIHAAAWYNSAPKERDV